jgi:hypothetical protein
VPGHYALSTVACPAPAAFGRLGCGRRHKHQDTTGFLAGARRSPRRPSPSKAPTHSRIQKAGK